MAERRMFSKKLVFSDLFLTLTDKAKVLYFYLVMSADDDGFVGSSRMVVRQCGANVKTLKALTERGLIIEFASGVCAIVHWRMQNKVAKDRYTKTIFEKEFLETRALPDGRYFIPKNESV